MAKRNVAKGNDVVAVQIGTVKGGKDKAAKQAPAAPPADVETTNVREGNATVGAQVDEIHGGLNFTFRRR